MVQRPKFILKCSQTGVLVFSNHTPLLSLGIQLKCCLTCAVTLPHAICTLLSQIHHYTIPLVGKSFAVRQPKPRSCKGKSMNLMWGEKKEVSTSAYSSVKNRVICKVCMRGFLTVPCCFVSAAHAAGTGIPYCLPGHWPGSAGVGLLAPWIVPDSQLDP